jgi:S-adenosylmethionine synthetase
VIRNGLFTSEAVSEGHPDKVADRISDELLDACLRQNPKARAAIETLVTKNRVVVAGEISGVPELDVATIVRDVIRDIGYTGPDFSPETVVIDNLLHEQGQEIANAVDAEGPGAGAGDQGLMFGYATNETKTLMPLALDLAHRILDRLTEMRKGGETSLLPDAKSQVTVEYRDGKPVSVRTVVVSHQHRAGEHPRVHGLIRNAVHEVIPSELCTSEMRVLVNPAGSFVSGGPAVDTGLTGRKIIVDTYGGAAPHGGGAFSGKDPTKVDRSAAYAARWIAKNIVAANIADRCLVQLAYVIGAAKPVSVSVETFGTSPENDWTLARAVERCVDLTPRGIRERLKLERPIYARTSSGGHFGRAPDADGHFSWEETSLVHELLEALP